MPKFKPLRKKDASQRKQNVSPTAEGNKQSSPDESSVDAASVQQEKGQNTPQKSFFQRSLTPTPVARQMTLVKKKQKRNEDKNNEEAKTSDKTPITAVSDIGGDKAVPSEDAQSFIGSKLSGPKSPSKRQVKKTYGPQSGNMAKTSFSKFKELRERTITRENWNYFVGDPEYKTDMFLRFKQPIIIKQFEKSLIASGAYSLRIVFLVLSVLDILLEEKDGYTTQQMLLKPLNLLFVLALLTTFPKFTARFQMGSKTCIMIYNLIPLKLGLKTLNIYREYVDNNLSLSYIMGPLTEQENQSRIAFQERSQCQGQICTLMIFIIIFIHNLPGLLVNAFVVSEWLTFLAMSSVSQLFYGILLFRQGHDSYDFFMKNLVAILINTTLFACMEKIRKELFVINITNSKTKKQLMKIFNQQSATVILSKDGVIQMCNDKFESFIMKQLKMNAIPANFLKSIANDAGSSTILQDVLQRANKMTNSYEPIQCEIVFNKSKIQRSSDEKRKSKNKDDEQEENKLQLSYANLDDQNYYEKYEAFKISVSQVNYKSSKSIMICFENITDIKAKFRLFGIHQRLVGHFVINNQKRMENLHMQLMGEEQFREVTGQVGELLGNSQVTYNMVQQLTHHFKNLSNLNDYRSTNFGLSEEIDYCLDGLTASKWEKDIEVYLTKGGLPRKVVGDLSKFRICMRTMLQFGVKYSKDNQMQVKCEFKTYTPEQHFVIQFCLVLAKNEAFDLEPVEMLLHNDEEHDADFSFNKIINEKYEQFFKHVKDFGVGMIVFPSVVKQLKGEYFIQTDTSNDNNSTLSHEQMQGKLKIGFKLPFEQAGMDSAISQQNYKINNMRKEADGKAIYSNSYTPDVSTQKRKLNKSEVEQMRSLMVGQGLTNTQSNKGITDGKMSSPLITNKSPSLSVSPQVATSSGAVNDTNAFMSSNQGFYNQAFSSNQKMPFTPQEEPRDLTANQQIPMFGKQNSQNQKALNQHDTITKPNSEVQPKPSSSKSILFNQPLSFMQKSMYSRNIQINFWNTRFFQFCKFVKVKPNIPQYEACRAIVYKGQSAINDTFNNSQYSIDRTLGSGSENIKNNTMTASGTHGTALQINGQPHPAINANLTDHFQSTPGNAGPKIMNGYNAQSLKKKKQPNIAEKMRNNLLGKTKDEGPTQQFFGSKQKNLNSNKDDSIADQSNGHQVSFSFMDGSIQQKSSHQQMLQKEEENDYIRENEGFSVPKSVEMESRVPGLKVPDDSENYDQVGSLNGKPKNEVMSDRSSQQYNFRMEKIDSLMMDSEDGLGLTIGSSKFGKTAEKQDPLKEVQQICAQAMIGKKSMVLSKVIHRTLYYNFDEMKGASKNLLGHVKQENAVTMQDLPGKDDEKGSQKDSLKQVCSMVDIKNQNSHGSVNSAPLKEEPQPKIDVKNNNVFLRTNLSVDIKKSQHPFMKNFRVKGNYETKIEFKPTAWNYLDEENQIEVKHTKAWKNNVILHPSEFNLEYDAQDRNQRLKIFNEILDDIENQEKQQLSSSPNVSRRQIGGDGETTPEEETKWDAHANENRKQIMLIVEDNHFMQQTVQQMLGQINVEFEEAKNGDECIEMCEKYLKDSKMFDIILMDLYMPMKDGFEAAIGVRKLEQKYGVPKSKKHFICGYSASTDLQVEKKCFDSGMDDIVAKPMEFKHLNKMLSEHDRRKKK